MRAIAILLIAACSSPPRPVAVAPTPRAAKVVRPTAPLDLAAFLAPPIDRRAARIVVQGAGQLELDSHDAQPGVPLDECHSIEAAVLEEHDHWVRIIEPARDAAIAHWIPEHYLADVITVKTPLLASRGAAPSAWLLPGAPVNILERDATHARVELRQLNDRAQGWVDAAALGRIYTRAAAPPPPDPRIITRGPILDAPSVRATSTFATMFGGPYERIGERHGFTELRYRSEWLDARGFVPTTDLQPPGPTGMCESMRTLFFAGPFLERHADDLHAGPMPVPANTCMRLTPDGPLVGVQRTDGVREVVIDRHGRWAQAAVAMTLGSFAVWMRVERKDGQLAIVPGC